MEKDVEELPKILLHKLSISLIQPVCQVIDAALVSTGSITEAWRAGCRRAGCIEADRINAADSSTNLNACSCESQERMENRHQCGHCGKYFSCINLSSSTEWEILICEQWFDGVKTNYSEPLGIGFNAQHIP